MTVLKSSRYVIPYGWLDRFEFPYGWLDRFELERRMLRLSSIWSDSYIGSTLFPLVCMESIRFALCSNLRSGSSLQEGRREPLEIYLHVRLVV